MRAKLLGVAVALALFVQPAAADFFTFEDTFTATPNVVQVGETVVLHLSIGLLVDPAAQTSVGTNGPGQLTIYSDFPFGGNALYASQFFPISLFNSSGSSVAFTDFDFAVSYNTPGVYSPFFQAQGIFSVLLPDAPFVQHVASSVSGSTSVQVVATPGPIAGAGLPGLVFASGGLLAWWRQKRNTPLV
jgi:hypothetical protein